jgi:hypothetical protein
MSEHESDMQLIARGLRRALSGQGSAFTAEEFERLEAIASGENGKGVDRKLDLPDWRARLS